MLLNKAWFAAKDSSIPDILALKFTEVSVVKAIFSKLVTLSERSINWDAELLSLELASWRTLAASIHILIDQGEKSFIACSTPVWSISVSNFRFILNPKELPFNPVTGFGLFFCVLGINISPEEELTSSKNNMPYKLVALLVGVAGS